MYALGEVLAHLALQVAFVLLVKSSQTIPVCPLSVCVDVHLHHTITHLERIWNEDRTHTVDS